MQPGGPPVYHSQPPAYTTQPPTANAPAPPAFNGYPAAGQQTAPQVNHQTSNNTVVINQPSSSSANRLVVVAKHQLNQRDWNSGICGCLNDITSCICGWMCLPILMCRLSNRLNECALISCCSPGGFITLRTKLRIMGGIKGSICDDCLMVACCGPCVACQMSREMDDMQL